MKIEFDEECQSCSGTGLFIGRAESFAEGVGEEDKEFIYEEVDTDTEYNIMEDMHE